MADKNNQTLADFSATVHGSLEHPIQSFGIGVQALLVIVMTTTVLATLVSVWCVAAGVIGLLITRKLCKKEPLLVDFLIQDISGQDTYWG